MELFKNNIGNDNTKNEADNDKKVRNYAYNKSGDYLSRDFIKEELEELTKNNIQIPSGLEKFYLENGYGFIHTADENQAYFNRILSPIEIFDYANGNYKELLSDNQAEIYDVYKNKGLIFMEICEGTFLWIGTQSDNYNCIYYFDSKIADSMDEFIEKYHANGFKMFND